jgi:hypothetical protein
LVRRVRGVGSSSRRDRYAERDTRAHRHHRDEPDIEDDEPLDVHLLQFEMSDEDMHEAHPEAEAEDEVEGDGGGEGEDEEVEFQNPFDMYVLIVQLYLNSFVFLFMA